jgi:hypothetical protein
MDQLDTGLLRDFNRFRSQVDWDYTLRNYIESRGSYELAVAFADLFWPDFQEIRGCIIRMSGFRQDNFDAWWERTRGDTLQIESVLNLLHIGELVPSDVSDLDDSVLAYLGHTIVDMWRCRLATLFPDRAMVVRMDSDGEFGPTVLVHQAPEP